MKGMQQVLENGSSILDHVPFPMMLTAQDATVLWWSKDAEETFGFTADEIVGKFYPFFEEFPAAIKKSTWDQVLHSHDPVRLENFILHSKHGEPVHVSAVLNSMTIGNRNCVMFLFEVNHVPTTNQASITQELASFKMGLESCACQY